MGTQVKLGAILLVLSASIAAAQELDPAPWRPAFDACVDGKAGDDLLTCKDSAAGPCMSAPNGGTNLGMTGCMAMEGGLWDDLLNDVWPGIMAGAQASDADLADVQGGAFAGQAEALLTAQRAWIAFRDAECELVWYSWGGGSMRLPATAACTRDLTAERVARLTDLTGAGL